MTNYYQDNCCRFEFRRDPKNDMLIGPGGCHYANERAAMYYGQLRFCGCGDPYSVHRFALQCLEGFDRDKLDWKDPAAGIAGINAAIAADPEAAANFIAYVLDQRNLVEHGSSIGGAWLTERGKQFLEIGAMTPEDDSDL